MPRIKIEKHELCVGVALPWEAYDEQGRVLLRESQTIDSPSELEALIERGIYRDDASAPSPLGPEERRADPFDALSRVALRLDRAFTALCARRGTAGEELFRVCDELRAQCQRDSDAMLGAVHLLNKTPYSIWHAIDTALIAELLGRRVNMDGARRTSLTAAALASNIGMLQLQESLYRQSTPCTGSQRREVQRHPQHSADILRHAAVHDEVCITAVLQHHERVNGSGYPEGLDGETITIEARIIGLADHYTALVSDRAYRSALSPFDALGDYLPETGDEFDRGLIQDLARELGVYPPGTFVRLQNGETAVIVKRAQGSAPPEASSFLNPRGEPYERPYRRDCGQEQFAIKAHCSPQAPLHFDLASLWGYATFPRDSGRA